MLPLQLKAAEAELATVVEQHLDTEFKKCTDLAMLHNTGLIPATGNRSGPMPLQLPPRFKHLVPPCASHIRLAQGRALLRRAGSTQG